MYIRAPVQSRNKNFILVFAFKKFDKMINDANAIKKINVISKVFFYY